MYEAGGASPANQDSKRFPSVVEQPATAIAVAREANACGTETFQRKLCIDRIAGHTVSRHGPESKQANRDKAGTIR